MIYHLQVRYHTRERVIIMMMINNMPIANKKTMKLSANVRKREYDKEKKKCFKVFFMRYFFALRP